MVNGVKFASNQVEYGQIIRIVQIIGFIMFVSGTVTAAIQYFSTEESLIESNDTTEWFEDLAEKGLVGLIIR